jgi:hypothetical protein
MFHRQGPGITLLQAEEPADVKSAICNTFYTLTGVKIGENNLRPWGGDIGRCDLVGKFERGEKKIGKLKKGGKT